MRATQTSTVSVPVDRVWQTLSDHEGMSRWAPGLKATLERQGTDEPGGVGAIRRLEAPGPAPAIVEEIVGFEPGRRLAYKALSGVPLRGYGGEVVLTAEGEKTRIDYSIDIEPRVPVVEDIAATVIARTLLTLLIRAARSA